MTRATYYLPVRHRMPQSGRATVYRTPSGWRASWRRRDGAIGGRWYPTHADAMRSAHRAAGVAT